PDSLPGAKTTALVRSIIGSSAAARGVQDSRKANKIASLIRMAMPPEWTVGAIVRERAEIARRKDPAGARPASGASRGPSARSGGATHSRRRRPITTVSKHGHAEIRLIRPERISLDGWLRS